MPRFTGREAGWESFRRWLIMRLTTLNGDGFLILTSPGRGYVQFINEGGNLLGESSDPSQASEGEPDPTIAKRIVQAGWGPRDEGSSSPNFQAKWFPTYVRAPTPGAPWTPDLDDAVDAADLAVPTLRDVLGTADPGELDVDGGQSMTVSSLDAELGTLFPGDDD